MIDVVRGFLEVEVEFNNFLLILLFNAFEEIFSSTASLRPCDVLTPRCSHSRMLLSTFPKSHFLIRLWMAIVTIFVMVGRQVMGL